jgi:alpha-glucosidase (family GH31 glycosyl hydrolase)
VSSVEREPIASLARAFAVDESRAWVPADVVVRPGAGGVVEIEASAPGSPTTVVTLPCGVCEHFTGFFEQFTQVDKRGRVINGWQHASVNQGSGHAPGLDGGYKIAPVFLSSAGWGAVVHSDRRWRVELGVRDPELVVIEVPGPSARITIATGSPAEVVSGLTGVIGRAPLAPPWAYGVWKDMRGGDKAVREEARRLREAGLGCSAIWLDAHYEEQTNSGFPAPGSYELGEYPDISSTVADLHELGFKALTYVNPYLYRKTPVHDEAVEKGFTLKGADGGPLHWPSLHPFEGDEFGILEETGIHTCIDAATVVDFSNPDAVAWWQGVVRRILVEEGFDGWMQDFGESVPLEAVPFQGTAEELSNTYPRLFHAAAREEQQRTKPDSLFFARGGWTGAQAHAPVFWPGDQTRDWSSTSGLASVVPAGISVGLMGVAAWGPDIGGNMGFPSLGGGFGGGSLDKELWLRWCQLGAMSPVMRDHLSFHAGVPVDLWTDDETIECWRQGAAWHLALFPYLWSLAHETSATGVPVMRGMMLEFPDDELSWVLTDQYLLGDALLCAPVLQKGARRRSVHLPVEGWFACADGSAVAGQGRVEIDAPLDRLPVLQRAGTVVPYLLDVPLDLNDARYAAGAFDLELRVALGAGSGLARRRLFDGTEITLAGDQLTATGPTSRRYVAATPDGRPLAEATGTSVTITVPPL